MMMNFPWHWPQTNIPENKYFGPRPVLVVALRWRAARIAAFCWWTVSCRALTRAQSPSSMIRK